MFTKKLSKKRKNNRRNAARRVQYNRRTNQVAPSRGLGSFVKEQFSNYVKALRAPYLSESKNSYDGRKLILDEKDKSYQLGIKVLRGMMRDIWGSNQYKVELSSYSGVTTSGVSVPQFNDIGAVSYISFVLSNSIIPEWSTWAALFDEFKVEGIAITYEPTNPYNRGVSVTSDIIGFLFDDNANISPAATAAGFIQMCENIRYFECFSPDHTKHFDRARPSPMYMYDWSPTSNPGVNNSSIGSLAVASPGTLTASTRYGAVRYVIRVLFQQRN